MTLTAVALLLALAAGVLSIFAPCVLPMLPVYLAYLTGQRRDSETGPRLLGALCFVAGFGAVFVLAFYVLRSLIGPFRLAVLFVFGLAVIVMAVKRLGWLTIPFLDHPLRLSQVPGQGPAAGALLGASLAFGWTPCMGPVLAAVLGQAILQQQSAAGLSLVIAYVVGLGLPFLLLAAFTTHSGRWLDLVRGHRRSLDIASSMVLVAIGLLLVTNDFAWLDRLSALASLAGGTR